jgi:hypothetical protein
MCLKFWDIGWIMFKKLKSIEWMECDFNSLCYELSKIPKIVIILNYFKHLK